VPDDGFASLAFPEAQEYLRQKVNVPSARYTDLLGAAHVRAFTVAGATKEGMLTDFRSAIQQAIDSGTTLEDFRKSFDDTVQKYGWSYHGSRGYRSRLIYETNISTAYSVGRYQQMIDPDVLRVQPYWQYRHSDAVKHPRPEHKAWDGLVLRHDDQWWQTHYPPNGWGCHCSVEPLSPRELKAMGKNGPDQAPASDDRDVTLPTSSGPITLSVPKGIDPGWGYNPGEAAHGRPGTPAPANSPMQVWQDGQDGWEILPPFDRQGAEGELPIDEAPAAPPAPASTADARAAAIRTAIGGARQALPLPDGDHLQVDAGELAQHIDAGLVPFIPMLPTIASDPAEIWLAFERDGVSGKVVLRKRLLKLIQTADGRRLLMMLQSSAGRLEAWKLLAGDGTRIQANRIGQMIWSRLGER
jgi:hypothetical protein